jgi:hypothetical protein
MEPCKHCGSTEEAVCWWFESHDDLEAPCGAESGDEDKFNDQGEDERG